MATSSLPSACCALVCMKCQLKTCDISGIAAAVMTRVKYLLFVLCLLILVKRRTYSLTNKHTYIHAYIQTYNHTNLQIYKQTCVRLEPLAFCNQPYRTCIPSPSRKSIESRDQVQPTVRGEKKLPKTAQELLKEMAGRPRRPRSYPPIHGPGPENRWCPPGDVFWFIMVYNPI